MSTSEYQPQGTDLEGTTLDHPTHDLVVDNQALEPAPPHPRGYHPFNLVTTPIIHHKLFDRFIVLVILANCVLMALEDPTADCESSPPKKCTQLQYFLSQFEIAFLAIFATEALLKIVSYGFISGPGAYLRDNWNVLDLFVVVVSFISLIPSVGNLQALRTFRLLRSLRSVSHIPAMRIVVTSLLRSMPLLLDVMLLVGFLIGVFAILGLHLFRGNLRQYCADEHGNFPPGDPNFQPDGWVRCSRGSDGHMCDPATGYGVCSVHPYLSFNPNYGITHYDHIGYSILTVFQCATAEGWTDTMYATKDTTGWGCAVFYLAIVWLINMIGLNIAFAALENAWAEVGVREDDLKDDKPAKESLLDVLVMFLRRHRVGRLVLRMSFQGTMVGKWAKRVYEHVVFVRFVLLAIVLNTIVLALHRADISQAEQTVLEKINLALTIVFAIEMGLKVMGLGLIEYVRIGMNVFDAVIVLVSLAELGLSSSGFLTVFRTLRLLRVLRLMRAWTSLQQLISGIIHSLRAAMSLMCVCVLLLFVFALLGKNFFGGKFGYTGARYNYDDFGWAFVSVFCVFSGENWNSSMYDGMANAGHGYAVYFVLLITLGNFIIFKLFIAILLDGLQAAHEDEEKKLLDEEFDSSIDAQLFQQLNDMLRMTSEPQAQSQENVPLVAGDEPSDPLQDSGPVPKLSFSVLSSRTEKPKSRRMKRLVMLRDRFDYYDKDHSGVIEVKEVRELLKFFNVELTKLEFTIIFADGRFTFEEFVQLMDAHRIEVDSVGGMVTARNTARAKPGTFTGAEVRVLKEYNLDPELLAHSQHVSEEVTLVGRSLYLFSPSSSTRKLCARLIMSKRFNQLILWCILGSTIALAMDEPNTSDSFKKQLNKVDVAFTSVFIFELVMKVIALGFFKGKHTYLRTSHFNKLDFVIIFLSCITLFLSDSRVSSLKALRAFRALRPLRTIGRIDSLKIVINALTQSAMPMLNALALMMFFLLVFAILGVHLFAGKFHYCADINSNTFSLDLFSNSTLPDCPNCDSVTCYASDCYSCKDAADDSTFTETTRIWTNYPLNFDDTISALVVLFGLSTLEQWTAVQLIAVDATGQGQWPVANHNRLYSLYFMVFVLCCAFFASQLFAGVACDKYQRMNEFYKGTIFLTDRQRMWVSSAKNVLKATPSTTLVNPIIPECLKIVRSSYFDNSIVVCIMLNMVVLSMYHTDMSPAFQKGLETANIVFVAIFGMEMALKLLGMGPEAYINEHWNKFDAVVVIISIVSLCVNVGGLASIFRIFRLARIVKLIPRAQRLMSVVMTVLYSIPALMNVGMLMLLLFVIYACLGMALFGQTVHGEFLNVYANFETFPIAMITLYRVTTGENWNGIMYDCALKEGDYNSSNVQCSGALGNCGLNGAAQVFFISFVVIAWYVLMNLVIAAVLIAFEQSKATFSDGLTQRMIDEFRRQWAELDPDGDSRIPVADFPKLYFGLAPVFGFENITELECQRFVKKIEDAGGEVRFSDVLYVFAFERFGISLGGSKPAKKLESKMRKREAVLDGEDDPEVKILPKLTEFQLAQMDEDDLREELRKRGYIRERKGNHRAGMRTESGFSDVQNNQL
eukprot:c12515_g4_i2.p1 GENE.c12515_g4_i2~~c12515_g4_i2.p1  ORF type:complete len:1711 (+),score=471.23 c12515_g4_i2:352-5133(+)